MSRPTAALPAARGVVGFYSLGLPVRGGRRDRPTPQGRATLPTAGEKSRPHIRRIAVSLFGAREPQPALEQARARAGPGKGKSNWVRGRHFFPARPGDPGPLAPARVAALACRK